MSQPHVYMLIGDDDKPIDAQRDRLATLLDDAEPARAVA